MICEAGEFPPGAERHRQKDFPNGGEWIGTAKSPARENNWFHAAFLKESRSDKNTKQLKCQASKGSKDPETTPKHAKKPVKAKTPTPTPPTPFFLPPPLSISSPSPSSFPVSPFQIKSDDNLADHSFYESEADSEPTKEHRNKKEKVDKEPISSSGKEKEASKQASKNHSPPPDGSSPLPSSDPQDEPEECSKKFKASGHLALDPLAIHSICNVDGEKVP
ncbi:hypothetical protein DSO57_1006090 [Entomophthora muscae]|uniref:Uncharacterized protein n=1 Tax=Entomophthora muscae TaxID=34485 RepID=A0ACC2SWP4_9FUNG|nr:hypothetical protein DSO57_1006090 [Entomophthora muscae]